MGLRGTKPRNKISNEWSANLAYAIGLIATDGCLYNDGRHINLTSKDDEQLNNLKRCLGIQNEIRYKASGFTKKGCYGYLQFSDVNFYNFLLSIGITPRKSKTLAKVKVPDRYFFDFLRGSFDGDGTIYAYWDKRWKNSYMFYITFYSASLLHVQWIQDRTRRLANITGRIRVSMQSGQVHKLEFAKKESKLILDKMFHSKDVICLSRKLEKIRITLAVDKNKSLMSKQ